MLHTAPQSPGVLHEILSRAGPLAATNAVSGERLQPGHIYVAPPDYHLTRTPPPYENEQLAGAETARLDTLQVRVFPDGAGGTLMTTSEVYPMPASVASIETQRRHRP